MAINIGNLGSGLTAAAVCVVLASGLGDMWRAHGEMKKAIDGQATALAASKKVETQLDGLAKGVQALAQAGNPNAQAIIAILKQNGVNINAGGS
jgi:hypothetical protein